eukprot:PhF_6_TR19194/c0_g1_i1/m.28227
MSIHPVLWWCIFANFLNQADRILMSFAIVPITEEFHLSYTTRGWILSSFAIGYIVTQMISGPVCVTSGSALKVLCNAVACWSVCTLLTPFFVVGLSSGWVFPLIVCRACMGLAEGFCWPAAYHAVNSHTPVEGRSKATAILVAAGTVGMLCGVGLGGFHWFNQFVGLGIVGLLFSFIMRFSISTYASQANPQPKSMLSFLNVFLALAKRKEMVAIYVAHFAGNCVLYLYFTWMPTYIHDVHNVPASSVSMLAIPLLCAAISGPIYGSLCDWVVHKKYAISLRSARVLMTAVSLLGPAVVALLMPHVTSAAGAVVLYSLSAICTSAHGAGYMANHGDVFPQQTGLTFGLSNTIATIPGLAMGPLGSLAIGAGRWDLLFDGVAVVC